MEIKKLEQQPEDIQIVFLEAVLMPSGEMMRFGKSLGYLNKDDFSGVYQNG